MSYDEYRDLFLKAQKNDLAPYKMFVLDIKGCRFLGSEGLVAQRKTMETINLMVQKILQIEKINGYEILVKDNGFIFKESLFQSPDTSVDALLNNPVILLGDAFHFSTYKDSITDDEFINLFQYAAKKLDNKYTYHFFSGNFETINYKESLEKYYIGYCAAELSENKRNVKFDISKDRIEKPYYKEK